MQPTQPHLQVDNSPVTMGLQGGAQDRLECEDEGDASMDVDLPSPSSDSSEEEKLPLDPVRLGRDARIMEQTQKRAADVLVSPTGLRPKSTKERRTSKDRTKQDKK